MTALPPQCYPAGDRTLVVEFARQPGAVVGARVRAAAEYLLLRPLPGVVDVVPAEASLAVHFDPVVVAALHETADPMQTLMQLVLLACSRAPAVPKARSRQIDIPVCYGGEHGEDLAEVAAHADMSVEEVVRVHSSGRYEVQMLGFLPGFAYLGGLDRKLAMPRRDVPRKRIPAGSVGIGGDQTGVYPFETPGGWNLIARTPMLLFRFGDDAGAMLAPGDQVRFVPITAGEYDSLEPKAA